MGHDIRYASCTAIKSQALADFIAEWTEVQLLTLNVTHEYWMMYFDGSLKLGGAGAGILCNTQVFGFHICTCIS